MLDRLLRQRRATVVSLVLVLLVLVGMGIGAWFMSDRMGSEITGFAAIGPDDTCGGTGFSITANTDLAGDITGCDGSDELEFNTYDDLTLDCKGYKISSTAGATLAIDTNYRDNLVIKNCVIEGFDTGISVHSSSEYILIHGNTFNNSKDIDIPSGENDVSVYNNHFMGQEVDDVASDTLFCVADEGNFYQSSLTPEAGDCGPVDITSPDENTQGTASGYEFRGNTSITLQWRAQDSPKTISYYADFANESAPSTWQTIGPGPVTNTNIAWDISDFVTPENFTIRITAYDGAINGTSDSMSIAIDNDNDRDGYSMISSRTSSDSWDCNDADSTIHQPSYRENSSSATITNACFNGVDDDCDSTTGGGTDWTDSGCGGSFSVGSLDDTLYTNGSIEDLTTSKLNISGNNYYVLASNSQGQVEYFTQTDLSSVDLASVFTIGHNTITGSSTQYSGRFNKAAKVTFKGLSEYTKTPIILVDGQPCNSTDCADQEPSLIETFSGTLSFDIGHFSTFTTTNNSRMVTFTHNGAEAAVLSSQYPAPLETYHRIKFFSNYSRYPSGIPVNNLTPSGNPETYNNGSCNITLRHPNASAISGADNVAMDYDDVYGVYEFESGVYNFTVPSDFYSYEIDCQSDVYEPVSASETFGVFDTTPPERPTLYPQILLHPSNLTSGLSTIVSGYFGESDIDYTVMVLHGSWTYAFNGSLGYSDTHSEYKGDDIVVNFGATKGQDVIFTAWSETTENALLQFRHVELSNHNRTYFRRYYITRANRTGDDMRVELNETLESDVPIGQSMRLYTQPYPAGYFFVNVSLFSGDNRITVWGDDLTGNSGNSSTDWISAAYLETAPAAAELWPLPAAVNESFQLIGKLNESVESLNLSVNVVQGDYINTTWEDVFRSSQLSAEAPVSQDRPVNASFFYIDGTSDYPTINSTLVWSDSWVEFSTHDRAYWIRYNVTSASKSPGQDARVYITPDLEQPITAATTRARFYDDSHPQGWFNNTVDINMLMNRTNEIYTVGFRGGIEGYPSVSQYVYKDMTPPVFDLTGIPNFSNTRYLTLRFNLSDDYKINYSSIQYVILSGTNGTIPTSCNDLSVNLSLLECQGIYNVTTNGTYLTWFYAEDVSGLATNISKNISVLITEVDITAVHDEDDITNDLWLNFNWDYTNGELQEFEYALGDEPYPDTDFDSVKAWTVMCSAAGNCTQDWVNFTHDSNELDLNLTELKMKTGTVYYLTVRAKSQAGDYGAIKSSNGIMFIDQTPPQFKNMTDEGSWTNSLTSLQADWEFEDNESDIIEYIYSIGNATYPNSGFENALTRKSVGGTHNYAYESGLSLTEGQKYYFNVKARNGNTQINYNGSWSGWQSSDGIVVDITPPWQGAVSYTGGYETTGYVTIQYSTGNDNASGLAGGINGVSGIAGGAILAGSSPLIDDTCQPISDIDFVNNTNVTTGQSYTEINVTSGNCYAFRLFIWDNAGNSITYKMQNETLRYVKADHTPPSDISTITDDGFFTFDRKQLHAAWTKASDSGTGMSHYYWRIFQDNTAEPNDCNISYTYINTSENINCSLFMDGSSAGNATNPELALTGLNLTHNHKYYFAITPFDRAGNNGTTTLSDGIIYIDNAPPGAVSIYTINEDNESSSPYYTQDRSGKINITAYGDLDGYEDIDNCVLLSEDIDYAEGGGSIVLANCTETRVLSNKSEFTIGLTNLSLITITEVFCDASTNSSGQSATQGNWSWHLSCRDEHWNTQSYSQNTLAWFAVDWPEPPLMSLSMGNISYGTPVYSDDDIYCEATIWDPDHYPGSALDPTNITITWKKDGQAILTQYTSASDPELDGVYNASAILDYSYTRRGGNIACNISADDELELTGSNESYVTINNTRPSRLELLSPNGATVKNMTYLSWIGPYDDIDSDFMTVEIQVDNESGFNASNNPSLTYGSPVKLTVNGIAVPGTQRNPDMYSDMIVYEDNRAGNWDIYLYRLSDDLESQVSSSADDQSNPMIYGDYVVYEEDIGSGMSKVYLYDIRSGTTSQLVSSVNSTGVHFFGDYVAYNDGSGLKYKDILSGDSGSVVSGTAGAKKMKVYGKHIVWIESDDVAYLYDIVSNQTVNLGGPYSDTELFGYLVALENTTGSIRAIDLFNRSDVDILAGYDASLEGALLARNDSGTIKLTDLLSDVLYDVSIGTAGANIRVYDSLILFDDGADIYYARQNTTLPFRFVRPASAPNIAAHGLDTTGSIDGRYYWRIRGCDSSFQDNACMWGTNSSNSSDPSTTDYTTLIIDNTPPGITSLSPTDGSIVAGQFRVYANISDSISDISYANYSITYSSGAVRASGDLSKSGSLWNSTLLDFLDVTVDSFTLTIWANDTIGNWNSAAIDFTVNSNTPWFLFGGRGGTEIIDGSTVFNASIDSDFIAFTVKDSSLKIVGPLPATTTRFIQSKTDSTVTNHNYSNSISVLTWPDGTYRVEMTGTNLDGTNSANRTFYVDQKNPQWSSNRTYPATAFAADLLTLSIDWADTTLDEVRFMHNNTDITNPSEQMQIFSSSVSEGPINSSAIDVSAYINRNFYWRSWALDEMGRTNNTADSGWFTVFINDDPPDFAGTITIGSVDEDSSITSGLPALSSYFTDPNDGGTWGDFDNLTFSATYDNSKLSISLDPATGAVNSLSAINDFNGGTTVIFNATDSFGKMNYSNSVAITVTPVQDAPRFSAIPTVYTTEDNTSVVSFDLSSYTAEPDGDSFWWLSPMYDSTVFDLDGSDTANGIFNFTLKADQFGLYNITFRAYDGVLYGYGNATVNIAGVNDAPVIGNFTYPPAGSTKGGIVQLAWQAATDQVNEQQTLNYAVEFSTDGGTSWTLVADYATLGSGLYYSWDTTTQISGEESVTLRLNVTDGVSVSTLTYPIFTVDNLPPQITVIRPRTTDVGSSITTQISTLQNASCTFSINNTGSPSISGTSETTAHQVTVSNLAYNVTYNLTVSCTDSPVGNSNTIYKLFEPRAHAMEFIQAYASPPWAYPGQHVNITLVIAANNSWKNMTASISPTSQSLTQINFTQEVNESNKYTHLTSSSGIDTSTLGTYNMTITELWTVDDQQVFPAAPILIQDILEVFTAVNQTLNMI
ncbi:hypothetical protein ACFL3V_01575 [Nanoarchaeota archaeon]